MKTTIAGAVAAEVMTDANTATEAGLATLKAILKLRDAVGKIPTMHPVDGLVTPKAIPKLRAADGSMAMKVITVRVAVVTVGVTKTKALIAVVLIASLSRKSIPGDLISWNFARILTPHRQLLTALHSRLQQSY